MRKISILLITIFPLIVLQGTSYAASNPQVEMVKKVMPAVVGIGIDRAGYVSYKFSEPGFLEEFKKFYQKEEKEFKEKSKPQWDEKKEKITPEDIRAIGSGFIISQDGKVITNYHVVEGQKRIFVITKDNKVYKANVIKESQEDDLAILEIEGKSKQFPYVKLGNSDLIEVAEPVLAIGNPFGLAFTVTSGIISAVGRTTPDGKGGLIQTDAAVNQGNSGGPLINMSGEAVGVNSMIYTSKGGGFIGIAFAVPINRAKTLLSSTPKGKGNVYLGVRLTATEKGLIAIYSVENGSPADVARLMAGDIIISVDGKEIRSANEFVKYIQSKSPGDKITLKTRRGVTITQVSVTLDRSKE